MKGTGFLLLLLLLLFALAGCSGSQAQAAPSTESIAVQEGSLQDTPVAAATAEEAMTTAELEAAGAGAASAEEAMAENSKTHEDAADYTWDESDEIPVELNGTSIRAGGQGVSVEGSVATIHASGTYRLSGSLSDGQIIVETEDEDMVRLILDGVDLNCSGSAPVFISKADKVVIILADGSANTVSDGLNYVFAEAGEDEPNAAVFSTANLTIAGSGSLRVYGNFNDGISSKDGLILAGGTLTVQAADDGIRGKDYLVMRDATVTVEAGGDGLKSDNEEDTGKGYVSVESGSVQVTSGGDAIDAASDAMITGGELTLVSGGGSSAAVDGMASTKGIKGRINVIIDGGTISIDAADDAIHSNGSLVINAGTLALASGDDGMHTDSTLTINNGAIVIANSYEGIESAVITINGGEINLTASDDGINVAGGVDGSGGGGPGGGMRPGGADGTMQAPGDRQGMRATIEAAGGMQALQETLQAGGEIPEGLPMIQGTPQAPGDWQGGMPGGGFGRDAFAATGDYHLYINGGNIYVDANGDGIDANGTIEMTDGIVIVNGPTERMNGALDFVSFTINSGFIVAAGSSGMAQAPGGTSSQNTLLLNFTAEQPAGSLVHIQDGSGQDILTFAPVKNYQSIAFSSPELVSGSTYEVFTGGSSTGASSGGLYQDGSYTSGSTYTTFTASSGLTQLGSGGGFRP